jgi:uncharacterized protein YkwD
MIAAMKLPRASLAVLFAGMLVGCGTGSGPDGGGGGGGGIDGGTAIDGGGGGGDPDADTNSDEEPAALAGITSAHNTVRAAVGVGPMVWDPDLAAVAQAWADQCIDVATPIGLIDHNAGRSEIYPGYVGENVYGSGGATTGPQAVELWAAELQYYNYESNTCNAPPGKSCGHYTQVVWSTSVRLGCGIKNCAGLQFGNSIVCNYSVGGNNGSKPY